MQSTVALLQQDMVLRLVRLDGEGEPRYALFLEPYQVRDLVSTAAKRYGLTAREADVMGLVLRGKSTFHIAEHLHISDTTVQQHVKNIGAKIGVPTRKAIVGAILGNR
jgi:DNA-binding CsgD family transcriptional regulator